jgi:D-amino-acid dehydrogenase
MTTVTVVGGGIAGLSAAYFLRQNGAEVTVLERNRVGSGASAGNAGWLCPAQAGPLPEPNLAARGLRSLTRPDSPLYFAPAYAPRMIPWLLRFTRNCNRRAYRRGVEALARLGRRTFPVVEQLEADGVSFELHRRGLVLAAETAAPIASFLTGLEPMRGLGYRIPEAVLSGAEVRELEPLLSSSVGAGALIEEHWHVDPLTLVNGLANRLREMGVEIEEGVEVLELGSGSQRRPRLRTSSGERETDAVILAAGAWTASLTASIGFGLPLQAGKGYSFEIDAEAMPHRAVELLDAYVVFTPLANRLRVAGTMEFSGVNNRLNEARIEAMVRAAARALPSLRVERIAHRWTGMRPIVPDGLPVIDRVPGHEAVYLAAAFSMLGMTLGPPAGEALARQILTGARPAELEPFRADRWRAPWRRPRAGQS